MIGSDRTRLARERLLYKVLGPVRKRPSFSSIVGVVLVVMFVVALVIGWQARRYGQVGAGYVARQMCACLYVQSRDEASCKAEIATQIGAQANMAQMVYLDERVIVNFSGLDLAEARLKPGYGCNVQDFVGTMPAAVLKEPSPND